MAKPTELTEDQIKDILKQATNPDWQIPFFHGLPLSLTEVCKVSIETGLIFIGGDDSIGVTHILNRHQGNKKHFGKEYYPTEFDFPIAPITYYELADKIFKGGNCIEKKHHHIYEATLNVEGSNYSIYRLVLFRDTKIVKTMYPVAVLDKRPKYEIGFGATYSHDLLSGIHTVEYRFHDEKNARFLLVVKYDEHNNRERRTIYILKKGYVKHNVIYDEEYPIRIQLQFLPLWFSTLKFPAEEKFVNDYVFINQ